MNEQELEELLPYLTEEERAELDRLLTAPAPLTFREFVELVNPRYRWFPHVIKLAEALQRVADGEISRLMVFMPPRHGKSELVSRLFTAYYLYRHPERWVGINSYAAELAYTFSRAARDNYIRAGGPRRNDAAAVKHWETGLGGGVWAAGVGGPITGKGFHLGVVDDPIKNAEQAASDKVRANQQEWWESTFYTREEPGGAIIVIQTRWHEKDLSGWLLDQEGADDQPERWHIVSMAAIRESDPPQFPATCTAQPDERKAGEPLCEERYSLARLKKIAKRIGVYFWNALFQQRPTAREGNFFKRAWFPIVDAAPAKAKRVRWWDRAATANGGDFTAGVLMAYAEGIWYVEDVMRGQWSGHERDKVILQTAEMDRERYGNTVRVWTEQEPGSSGKDAAVAFARMLAGYPVASETTTGSKEVMADPFASQCEAGNVKLVKGLWNRDFIEELCAFPNGANDDQVDAGSRAFIKAPLVRGERPQARSH